MEAKNYKIVVYVPTSHCDKVREALEKNGAGHIGNYDSCSFTSKGVGRFMALKGADPFIGKIGVIEEVEEDRVETICAGEILEDVLAAVRMVHPYEEPVIDVYPLLDF